MKKIETSNTSIVSIKHYILLHFVILMYSFGGVLSKTASKYDFLSLEFILIYAVIVINLAIYAICWQQILKRISLITAFCNKAITIVWGIVWGFVIFKEPVTWNMLVGAVIVIVGVIIVVKSDEPKSQTVLDEVRADE